MLSNAVVSRMVCGCLDSSLGLASTGLTGISIGVIMTCENVVRASLPFPISPWMTELTQSLCGKGFTSVQIVTLLLEMFLREDEGSQADARSGYELHRAFMKLDQDKTELLAVLEGIAAKLKDDGVGFTWVQLMQWIRDAKIEISDDGLAFFYRRFRNGWIRSKDAFIREVIEYLASPAVSLSSILSVTKR